MGIDPATLAMIAIGTQVAGAVVQAGAAAGKGEADAAAARYQAAVSRNNAIIAERNAQAELQRGQQLEASKRERTAQALATQRARMAASGLAIDTGSPLRLQEDVAGLGELDALTIRNNAARAAYGYRVQGMSFESQAGLLGMQAEGAEKGGQIGAFTSIIGGASGVSDKWLRYQQAGVEGF